MARFIPLGLHRGGFARSSVPVRRQRLTSECSVDAPRDVVFLPLLLLLPGHGSFGSLKGRVLFAGVEYLENEPSSLTADLTGRQPAGAGLGQDHLSAHGRAGARALRRPDLGSRTGAMRLFDSPDRLFGTEGHVLGLLAPGAEGPNCIDGELLPLEPLKSA